MRKRNWNAFHLFLLFLILLAYNIFFVQAEEKSLNGRNIQVLPLGVIFKLFFYLFVLMKRNYFLALLAHSSCDRREKRNRSHCKIVRCLCFGFGMDFRETQLYVSF